MKWEYKLNNTKESLNSDEILSILLKNRNITSKEEIEKFINPSLKDFRNPFEFETMENVVALLIKAKQKHEKVYIYGDYDVDGITACVFMCKVLNNIGIKAKPYIPNRMEEGYGLDKRAINFMKRKKTSLILTVDTGVNSLSDVEYANSLGMKVIVTDHHRYEEHVNHDGYILLNPKMSKTYGFKYLSGAGVALKVAQGLYMKLNRSLQEIYDYLDIVMIGTVADVVPMIDENRIIIKEGLKALANTKVKGLRYLLRYLKLQNKEITTIDVSYYISPLINSLGRIGISKIGAKFFLEEDEFMIYNIIEDMKKANKRRRELENRITLDAEEMIKKRKDENLSSAFLYSNKWHPGVIGVVASRLSIKYNMPIALVSLKDEVGKASCRSVQGLSVFDIFEKMKDEFIRFGGHDMAAGFIVDKKNIEKVKKIFQENAKNGKIIREEKKLTIDMPYNIHDIGKDLFEALDKLSPYGVENPNPLFVDYDVKFIFTKKFGVNDRHFNAIIEKDNKTYNAVAFDLGDKIDEDLCQRLKFDIVYYPQKIFYKDEEILQIRIKDIKIKK